VTTGSGEAPSKIDAAEMNRVRVRIEEIIQAMIAWAARSKITSERLRAAYRSIHGHQSRSAMRLHKALAYDELFGFGYNARKYLFRSQDTSERDRPIGLKHIGNIRQTLAVLNICDALPNVGEHPTTWWPFLDHAYEQIVRAPHPSADHQAKDPDSAPLVSTAAAGRGPAAQTTPVTVSPSHQLRAILERMSDQRRVGIELAPVKEEHESATVVRVRKIGRRNTLATLRPGPHSLSYTTPFPQTDTVALLALEHDRESDEWVLINAVPETDLPLNRGSPASGTHRSALHVQPAAGVFDLFLVAAVSGFSNHLGPLAQQLIEEGHDGVLSGETLTAFIDALAVKASRDAAEDFAAGCFSYRVRD